MLAVGESVNLFFSHVRESSFISRSVIEIMMLMLWEGGWEWTTLTISSEIWSSSSSSSSSIPTPYIYTPPPPFWGYDRTLSPSFAPPYQFFASCARSSVAGRTVFTTLLENRFSKRTVFTMANEIGFPGLTIFTIVLKRAFLYAQFLQYFLRRGVKKH